MKTTRTYSHVATLVRTRIGTYEGARVYRKSDGRFVGTLRRTERGAWIVAGSPSPMAHRHLGRAVVLGTVGYTEAGVDLTKGRWDGDREERITLPATYGSCVVGPQGPVIPHATERRGAKRFDTWNTTDLPDGRYRFTVALPYGKGRRVFEAAVYGGELLEL